MSDHNNNYSSFHSNHSILPFINDPPRSNSSSRRIQSRYNNRCAILNYTNNCIGALNRMTHGSYVSLYPNIFPFSSQPIVERFHSQNIPNVSIPHDEVPSLPAHQQRSINMIINESSKLHAARRNMNVSDSLLYDNAFDASYLGNHSAPIPIIADSIALPTVAGTVNILDLLPPHLIQTFTHDIASLIKHEDDRNSAACVQMSHNSRPEYIKLLHRMVAANMIDISEQQPLCVNGLFAVPKPGADNEQRLIMDARPANACMVEPPWFSLPTPDILSSLSPSSSQPLFIAKCDVSNYFHMIRVPSQWSQWFGLPHIMSNELGINGPNRMLWPRCTTLPMGWSYSAFLAQQCHESLLQRIGLSSHLINHNNDMNINRTRISCYIDDVVFIGHDRDQVTAMQQHYEQSMIRTGLPTKLSKRIPPTSGDVECVGLLMNGTTHRISLHPTKLIRLITDTHVLIRRRHITGRELMRIIGRWTWACLVRRPSLSIFNSVYAFARTHEHHHYELWRSCIKELDMMCGIAPLLYCDMSTRYCPWVVATDASLSGEGVTITNWSSNLQRHLHTHKLNDVLRQRAYRRTIINTNNYDLPFNDALIDSFNRSSLSHHVTRSNWSTVIASRWRFRSLTINELEARAVKSAITWVRSRPYAFGTRVTLLTDSGVVAATLQRGRSSAIALRTTSRSIAGLLLSSGLFLNIHWVPSHLNPADGPSRC
jgi:hypothetical protein